MSAAPRQAASPLRIAHVMLGRANPQSANGIDQVIYHLTRHHAQAGHAVAIFSITPKPPIAVPGVETRTYEPWRMPPWLQGGRLGELWITRHPLNVPRRMLAELFAWKPDLVHLHSVFIPQNLTIARALRRRRVPYWVSIHGQLTVRRGRPWQTLYNRLASRVLLDHAVAIHAISEQDMARLRGYDVRVPARIIPIGVPLDQLEPVAGTPPPPTETPAGARVFLFLGRLDVEQKGLDALLEGFAALDDDAVLVLVGPDWQGGRKALERHVRSRGLEQRVRLVGPAHGPDKVAWLRSATVFVHPSRWEGGVPTAVLEAAAVGKPLMLTTGVDTGGAFVRHGAAQLVEPEAASIAAGLRRLTAMSPAELGAMGARAREVVEQGFGWKPIAHAMVDAYRESLGRV